MISEKLYAEDELSEEAGTGTMTRYTNMLKHNNRLLAERLKAAIGFLELQEKHMKEGIVFFWREMTLE